MLSAAWSHQHDAPDWREKNLSPFSFPQRPPCRRPTLPGKQQLLPRALVAPTLIPAPGCRCPNTRWGGTRTGGETGREGTKGTLKRGGNLQLVGNCFFGNTEN